jgi:hypothetical protein
VSGGSAGFQAPISKKRIYIMHHRQALAIRNRSEIAEVQTIYKTVVRVVNCVKNSTLRGKRFATFYDNMEALILYCESRLLSCAKVLHRVTYLRERYSHFCN